MFPLPVSAPRSSNCRTASRTWMSSGASGRQDAGPVDGDGPAVADLGEAAAAPHSPGPMSDRRQRRDEFRLAPRHVAPVEPSTDRRAARRMTAARAMVIWSSTQVSSCSHPRRSVPPSMSSCLTPAANVTSSSSASCGGTCPVSASSEFLPARTRSNGPSRRSAPRSARAVAMVSLPSKAGSVRRTPLMSAPRSRPQAIASRRTSSAAGGPRVSTVTEPPSADVTSVDGLADCASAVRAHLQVHAVAHEPPVGAQLHLVDGRNLLHQHSDSQRRTCRRHAHGYTSGEGSRHPDCLTGRNGRSRMLAVYCQLCSRATLQSVDNHTQGRSSGDTATATARIPSALQLPRRHRCAPRATYERLRSSAPVQEGGVVVSARREVAGGAAQSGRLYLRTRFPSAERARC